MRRLVVDVDDLSHVMPSAAYLSAMCTSSEMNIHAENSCGDGFKSVEIHVMLDAVAYKVSTVKVYQAVNYPPSVCNSGAVCDVSHVITWYCRNEHFHNSKPRWIKISSIILTLYNSQPDNTPTASTSAYKSTRRRGESESRHPGNREHVLYKLSVSRTTRTQFGRCSMTCLYVMCMRSMSGRRCFE